jgi:hypothetical protein
MFNAYYVCNRLFDAYEIRMRRFREMPINLTNEILEIFLFILQEEKIYHAKNCNIR